MPDEKRDQRDEDAGKGAVEQDSPEQDTNVSFAGQSGHRDQDPLLKSSDTDFPEPGQNEEHTGEPEGKNQLTDDTKLGCGRSTPNQQPSSKPKQARTGADNELLAD